MLGYLAKRKSEAGVPNNSNAFRIGPTVPNRGLPPEKGTPQKITPEAFDSLFGGTARSRKHIGRRQ